MNTCPRERANPRHWGGAALEIGSATLPVGAAGASAKIAAKLAPKIGAKTAEFIAKTAVNDIISGIVSGSGDAMLNDKNFLEAITTDVVMSVAGSVGGKKLGEILNKKELRERIAKAADEKVKDVLFRKGLADIKNIKNPENLPRSRHLQDFGSGNIEESTVGEMLNDEYFRKSGKLKEVVNIKVKMISWEEYKKRPQINGYIHPEENPPVIYLSPVLTLDEKEYVLYHELYHIRQIKAILNGNEKYKKSFENYKYLQKEIIALEQKAGSNQGSVNELLIQKKKLLYNHFLELSAENSALRQYKQRRIYYGK